MPRVPMPMMPTGVPNAPSRDEGATSNGNGCSSRVLVVLPTYMELATLPFVIEHVLAAVPNAHVLVIDDDSPDGTGAWAEERTRTEPRLSVLHRPSKLGVASAKQQGFAWGLACGFQVLCEMDSDGSHAPSALTRLLGALDDGADLVLGSRYVAGGGAADGPLGRGVLSRASNAIARRLLGLPVRDMTTGYRVCGVTILLPLSRG